MSISEPRYSYSLVPIAGGGYQTVFYDNGGYMTRRYFNNISDAADWGEAYVWGLNNES